MADGSLCHEILHSCNRVDDARTAMRDAQQLHMLAIQSALSAGMPMDEIVHAFDGFSSTARHLTYVCGTPDGRAPMDLGYRA